MPNPPGIERRILQAIQARETVASVPFWKRLRPQTLPAFAIWLASALAITGALVAIALHQRWGLPAHSSHPSTLAVRQERPAEVSTQKAPIPARRPASRVWSKHSRTVTPVAGPPGRQLPCTASAFNRAGEVAVAPGPSP